MAAGDLVNDTTALSFVGGNDPCGVIPLLVSAASAQIQNWIGYQIAQASYTRTFNGSGGRTLFLPDRPVVSVASVTVDGISIAASTSPTTPGFVADGKAVYLRCYEFCRGVQNIVVGYTAGFAKTPPDLQAACLNWVSSLFATVGENPAISNYRAGDTQVEFAQVVTEVGNMVALMPPIVAAAIQPYRRIAT